MEAITLRGRAVQQGIAFSGNPLDRVANQRRDEAWLAEQFAAPGGRYLAIWRQNVLAQEAEGVRLHWLSDSVREHLAEGAAPLLLGVRDGVAHFAVDLSALDDPVATLALDGATF